MTSNTRAPSRVVLICIIILLLALSGCSEAQSQGITGVAPSAPIPMDLPPTDPPPTATPAPTATVSPTPAPPAFDGQRAYADVEYQVSLGPRLPGSEAHAKLVDWLQEELAASGWAVELQETTYQGQPVRNVIAKRGEGDEPWVILGAHFDSRLQADNDPDPANHDQPVPGANDGASGVAVLLELARVLPKELDRQVWLAFFDSEDQGRLPGWDWIYGSRAFAGALEGTPDAVVILDMIGDADLNIPQERNSDPGLLQEIWAVAAERGHDDFFLPQPGYAMLDDHTPFLENGIRAADLIDFDYPYWHTVADTPDKVSAESLFVVGDTVLHWLLDPDSVRQLSP